MCTATNLSSKLMLKIGKWRLLLLLFMLPYVSLLILDLAKMTLYWDEANNLIGGLLILRGLLPRYLETNMFYPPLADVTISGYFAVFGVSVFSGRLLGVTFAVLSIIVTFELANRLYDAKTAFLASVFLATTTGFVWLARLTMLETMLIFFFSATILLFFIWLQKHENKYLILSGLTLGLGFLTKYQVVIALIAMIVSICLLCRGQIKAKLKRFPLLVLTAILVALPWIIIAYQSYSAGMLNQWLYALQMGNPDKAVYSSRFPAPVFYLIEMVWPYSSFHPISFLLYGLGLAGLALFFLRRKPQDKYLLIFFFVVYIFFSLIGNKEWRYIVPVFPIISISAASLITHAYDLTKKAAKNASPSLAKRRTNKFLSVALLILVAFTLTYNCLDTYQWMSTRSTFEVPVKEATEYVAAKLGNNESLAVLCAVNVFSQDIVRFYLYAEESRPQRVAQYPSKPVDAYTPTFNTSELSELCATRNIKYLMLFEYGGRYPYFNSTLNSEQVYNTLTDSQLFKYQNSFGEYPCRIYIFTFEPHQSE
ncbi:MAG: glycosyltransferase family 39 protein [Candidatus Bathyarchaeota archaeon]|nr:glycosyltransferase family 39 protein [Candidatus Bathyarchaeota archaeon]